jgi:uncharacterized protein
MTQQQVAERAGLAQSVVSAYERGRREPSLPMLRRLIEATGGTLTIRVERPPLLDRVRARKGDLLKAFGRFGAVDVRVFGSAARGDETATSDVDLLFHAEPALDLFAVAELQLEVERILGVPVDVVPDDSVKPGVLPEVLRDAVPL